MSRFLPLPVFALLLAAGCRSEGADVGAPARSNGETTNASPTIVAQVAAVAPAGKT
jgi:hypothetical protein